MREIYLHDLLRHAYSSSNVTKATFCSEFLKLRCEKELAYIYVQLRPSMSADLLDIKRREG
jgi:hypothetical protein